MSVHRSTLQEEQHVQPVLCEAEASGSLYPQVCSEAVLRHLYGLTGHAAPPALPPAATNETDTYPDQESRDTPGAGSAPLYTETHLPSQSMEHLSLFFLLEWQRVVLVFWSIGSSY